MTLNEFLKVIGGEIVELRDRPVDTIYYGGDKNAIRMYRAEDLEREIYSIEPKGKRFIVTFKLKRDDTQ